MTEDLSAAIFSSWSVSFWPTLFLLLLSLVYLRGWRSAAASRPQELPLWRLFSFHAGLLILWLSISSPLDALGQFLLVAHMTQHLLLMSVVPPLLLLGAPTVPLLRGIPRVWMREVVACWVDFRPFQAIGRVVSHPLFGWLAMNAAYGLWHIPALYELALRSNDWHYVEHACFLFGSLAYWWHVVQPWPSQSAWSRWLILPYIVSADVVNTIISASLAFSAHVVYPTYAAVPRIFEITALDDQMAAGAEMWVIGSMISLIPLMAAVLELLSFTKKRTQQPVRATSEPKKDVVPWNLLSLPLFGRLLRWKYGRLLLQMASFLLMLLIVAHGLQGVRLSALNLAGGFLWMLLRPLLFLLILCVANLFCMACPFTFPRELARFFWKPTRRWPLALRNKWIAIALTVLFFWLYLECDLWNWPSATAWLLIGYAAGALLLDSLFAGASFCKYVCPVGQFNFLTSLVAPLSLGVRERGICTSCAGYDCVRGNPRQRGCELQLFLPQKIGNLDCTLCMDCVKACPEDNLQMVVLSPVRELVDDPHRSSVGRFSQRIDLAVLVLVFVLFAGWNAAAMTAPVLATMSILGARFPWLTLQPVRLLAFLAIVGVALLLVAAVSGCIRPILRSASLKPVFCRFSFALLPMGLSIWTAHLLFHLTTAGSNLLPVAEQFFSDMGFGNSFHWFAALQSSAAPALCSPGMVMLAVGGGGTSLLSLQIWILDAGALASLYLLWWGFRRRSGSLQRTAAAWAIALLSVALVYGAALWIFAQPMLMPGAGGQG